MGIVLVHDDLEQIDEEYRENTSRMVPKLAMVVRMAMTPLCSEKMIHQKTSWNLKGEVRKRRKNRKKTMKQKNRSKDEN